MLRQFMASLALLVSACCAASEPPRSIAAVTPEERAEKAESILCPNGVNGWDEDNGPSCD